jgi:hypothetical protein
VARPKKTASRDRGGEEADAGAPNARTLQWAEIAGLIAIGADGSWQPTEFGKALLLKLEREEAAVQDLASAFL